MANGFVQIESGGRDAMHARATAPRAPFGAGAFAFALAALSGAFYFLSFAGFDVWPLSAAAFVPLYLALRLARPQHLPSGRVALVLGLVSGLVANLGGYYWLVPTLERFAAMPSFVCFAIVFVVALYQGGQQALFAWLLVRVRRAGWPALALSPLLYVAVEQIYPLLFPSYLGNALHDVPILAQVVDLGGPLLLSSILVAQSAAVYAALRALHARAAFPVRGVLAAGALLGFTAAYGAYRVATLERAIARAPKLDVGLVQANLGAFEKRRSIEAGLRRQLELSRRLIADGAPDLIVWPESAVQYVLPLNLRRASVVAPELGVPLLFGGLGSRSDRDGRRLFNAAWLADRAGRIEGRYAKNVLLPFAEYLPFGKELPLLHRLSPNSGRFAAGQGAPAMRLADGTRLSTSICYEGILPDTIRRAVAQARPHVLVNLTNDRWFGDTHGPLLHFALAKFRAIEHHRALIRSTNSGITAVVDPLGRTAARAPSFAQTTLRAQVPLLSGGPTLYGLAGDWVGWVALLFTAALLVRKPPPHAP